MSCPFLSYSSCLDRFHKIMTLGANLFCVDCAGLACDASVDCVIALCSSLDVNPLSTRQLVIRSKHPNTFNTIFSFPRMPSAYQLSICNQRKTIFFFFFFFRVCGYKHAGTELMAQTLQIFRQKLLLALNKLSVFQFVYARRLKGHYFSFTQ